MHCVLDVVSQEVCKFWFYLSPQPKTRERKPEGFDGSLCSGARLCYTHICLVKAHLEHMES